jgi:glycosyltransferase involved in cell wall biosynthesis
MVAPLPLVSVITPTWKRPDLLWGRCVPSVLAQVYPRVEHIVVSDGPDPSFRKGPDPLQHWPAFLVVAYELLAYELPEHKEGLKGSHVRQAGLKAASGEFIAYLDDDDAYRPEHLWQLVSRLLANAHLGFAYSQMYCHDPSGAGDVVFSDPPRLGGIGSPMVVHRREILETATWGPDSATEDWDLVSKWMSAGIQYEAVEQVTVDVYPASRYAR